MPFYGFDYLKHEEIDLVRKNSRELNFNPREMLCKQGSFATHILHINEGLAKIYFESSHSEDMILRIASSGTFLRLTALHGENRFPFSAMSYDHTKAHLIGIKVFSELLNSNAEFSSEVIKILNFDANMNFERFYSLTSKQLHGRMADILLCLAKKYTIIMNSGCPFPVQTWENSRTCPRKVL